MFHFWYSLQKSYGNIRSVIIDFKVYRAYFWSHRPKTKLTDWLTEIAERRIEIAERPSQAHAAFLQIFCAQSRDGRYKSFEELQEQDVKEEVCNIVRLSEALFNLVWEFLSLILSLCNFLST